jgi:hypothetical protein
VLRFRVLSITVNTDTGRFGVRHTFTDGLNIIRAANSAGKSTIIQSLIYALGLEGMSSPSHDIQLQHALTSYLDYPDGRATVLDSSVMLEIENGKGEFLTVKRSIIGEMDHRLITVLEGAALSKQQGLDSPSDYFVRVTRSAASQKGFHNRLALFLDWELPLASRFDGEDSLPGIARHSCGSDQTCRAGHYSDEKLSHCGTQR